MSKKHLFLGLLIALFIIVPVFSNAELSADDIARQIVSLRQKIAELQRQLAQLQGQQQGVGWCHAFNVNLGVGMGGQTSGARAVDSVDGDVNALIQVLSKEGFLNYDQVVQPGSAGMSLKATYFSETVAAAVSSFQLKYKSEILTLNGLNAPTGYVGPATRRVLNRLYGCNRPMPVGNQPPIISGVSGPTTLNVGQSGTWEVKASDPENSPLSYSVIWGDEINFDGIVADTPSMPPFQQTTTFTHSYSIANTYRPTFTVTDNFGQRNQTRISVLVGGQNSNKNITVTSPNGGEQWVVNSTQAITWRYNGATTGASTPKVDLYLYRSRPCHTSMCLAIYNPPIVLDKNISAVSTYNWIVATDIVNNAIQIGNYYLDVCSAGSLTNCDSSDNYFTILPK